MSTMRVTNLKHENSASNNIVLNSDGSVGGDLATTFASKVDYATPTNAQTGTAYTFVADDAERITTASNGSAVTFTIPPQSSVTWGDDTILRVVNYGAGAVTVDGGSGVTVTNTATTLAQYQSAAAIRTGSDAWTLVPFAGGGAAELKAADISATTGTVSSATSGGFTTYVWTTSGSITFSKAGFISNVLCVGGGGGGGNGSGAGEAGGGGGAGGLLNAEDYLVTEDTLTLTVTVGDGGAGGSSSTDSDPGEASSIGNLIAVGGGAGASTGLIGTPTFGGDGASGGGGSTGGASSNGKTLAAPQGNDGGTGTATTDNGGGGGGAGAAGSNAGANGGDGGAGIDVSATYGSIGGASGVFAGGGGGGAETGSAGAGGSGGGGGGTTSGTATSGTANTGGGGGGTAGAGSGGSGASGIVAIRVVA